MPFLNNEHGKHLENPSKLLLQPQYKDLETNRSPISSHTNFRDTTVTLSERRSQRLVSLINIFEDLDSMAVSIPKVPHQVNTFWSEQKLLQKISGKDASRSISQLEFSRLNEDLPEAENTSEKIIIVIKPLQIENTCCEDHTNNRMETSLPISLERSEYSGFNGKPIEDHQIVTEKVPTLQNCITRKRRVASLQDKINFFEDRASAKNSKIKSIAINQSALVQGSIHEVKNVNPNSESKISVERKSNQRVISNEPILIPGKILGHRDSVCRNISVTSILKQGIASSWTDHMLPVTPPIPDCRKMSEESCLFKSEIFSSISTKDYDSHLGNKDAWQEKGDFREQKLVTENTIRGLKKFSRKPSEKIEAIYRQGLNQRLDSAEKIRGENLGLYLPPKPQLSNRMQSSSCKSSYSKMQSDNRDDLKFAHSWKNCGTRLSIDEEKVINVPKETIISYSSEFSSSGKNCGPSPQPAWGWSSRDSSPKSSPLAHFIRTEHVKSKSDHKCIFLVPHQRFERSEQNFNVTSSIKNAESSGAVLEDKVRKSRNKILEGLTYDLNEKKNSNSNFGPVINKIKTFEGNDIVKRIKDTPKKRHVTRKLNRSLKEIFEGWSSSEKSRKIIKNPSTENIEDPHTEFQNKNSQNNWRQNILDNKFSSNNFQFLNIERTLGKRGNACPMGQADFWLIRQVNCGLNQPKPLRAVEIKRMMLLCREKIAEISNLKDGLT